MIFYQLFKQNVLTEKGQRHGDNCGRGRQHHGPPARRPHYHQQPPISHYNPFFPSSFSPFIGGMNFPKSLMDPIISAWMKNIDEDPSKSTSPSDKSFEDVLRDAIKEYLGENVDEPNQTEKKDPAAETPSAEEEKQAEEKVDPAVEKPADEPAAAPEKHPLTGLSPEDQAQLEALLMKIAAKA